MKYPYRKPHFTPRFAPVQRTSNEHATTLPLPGYHQARTYSCGYACSLMVARYFGSDIVAEELFRRLGTGRDGTRQNAIVRELRACGLRANVRYDLGFDGICRAIGGDKLVVSYLADAEHWIVLYGYGRWPERVFVADPRPEEPCEHAWDCYGSRMKCFGIVCSRQGSAAEHVPLPMAPVTQPPAEEASPVQPVQLAFEF